jgi:hypothetical protein
VPQGVPDGAYHRRRLARVTVSGPRVSAAAADVETLCDRVFAVGQAPEHLLELEWDRAEAGAAHDFTAS